MVLRKAAALAFGLAIAAVCAQSTTAASITTFEYSFEGTLDDMQWAGEESETVLFLTSYGEVHVSKTQGKEFVNLKEQLSKITSPLMPNDISIREIAVHSANKNVVYLLSKGTVHYVSRNGGQTFEFFRSPAVIEEFKTHPIFPNAFLISGSSNACNSQHQVENKLDDGNDRDGKASCYRALYVSTNFGQDFRFIDKYLVQMDWEYGLKSAVKKPKSASAALQLGGILYSAKHHKSGNQRIGFWDSDVNLRLVTVEGTDGKTLVDGGNRFLFTERFIFVAQVVNDKETEVKLQLSSDGLVSFYSGTLPFKLTQHSYTVLDASEGIVFLHVNHHGDRAKYGHIYVSDSTGMNYTFSLRDNARDGVGKCDFSKVLSIEGVYISNYISNVDELESNSDNSNSKIHSPTPKIRSVISFDRGGEWALLRPPSKDSEGSPIQCLAPSCALHLHSHTSSNAPVYSSDNAIGIVLGVGNVGEYISPKPGDLNTYISNDGGLNWQEIRKGSHIYEIGDHGGLLVMAKDQERTNKLLYSWKQGQEWTEVAFSNVQMDVDNIIIEPSATSRIFHVYGVRNTPGNTGGVLITVDFQGLHERECAGASMPQNTDSDYEIWSPRDTPNSPGGFGTACHMGHIIEYVRRKQSAPCFNPKRFEASTFVQNCACTDIDYECDFGYVRKGPHSPCERDLAVSNTSLAPPKHCPSSGYYSVSNGYRRVGGNTCVGGKDLGATIYHCSHGILGVSLSGWFVLFVIIALIVGMFYQGRGNRSKGYDSFGTQNFGGDEVNSCWDGIRSFIRDPDVRARILTSYQRNSHGFPDSAMDFGDDDFVEHGDEFDLDDDDAIDVEVEAQLVTASTEASLSNVSRESALETFSESSTTSNKVPKLNAPPTSAPLDIFDDEDQGDAV